MQHSIEEAARRGSRTVEAEDILLALASSGSDTTREVLAQAGLDHESLLSALRTERRTSLAAAGFDRSDDALLESAPRSERPTWGTSVREAMGRARRQVGRAGSREATELGMVVGVLLANLGTVPRALALAEIDLDALIGRLQRAYLR